MVLSHEADGGPAAGVVSLLGRRALGISVGANAGEHRRQIAAPHALLVVEEQAAHEPVDHAALILVGPDDAASAPRQHVEPVARRAHNEVAGGVFRQTDHAVHVGIGEGEAAERVGGVVIAHESLAAAYPELLAAVYEEGGDFVALQRCGVACVSEILHKLIAVEAVQTVLGAYPDKSVGILHDTADGTTRHLV